MNEQELLAESGSTPIIPETADEHLWLELLTNRAKSYDEVGTPCVFLTGRAGTGKSTLLQQLAQADPRFGLFTCSTGIAAINLGNGATTIHSALGFSDTTTCRAAYNDKWMHKAIKKKLYQIFWWLVIDEISMLPGAVLQIIYDAIDEVNRERPYLPPLGILATGDPLQLSPVQEDLMLDGRKIFDPKSHRPQKAAIDWPYNVPCWRKFEDNTVRLGKIWRQDNPQFIKALGEIRRGNGLGGAQLLKLSGVRFFNSPEEAANPEDATVIVGTNKMVDKINLDRLDAEPGESFTVESKRWYARKYPPQEWKHIPDMMELKIGALVMILANESPGFRYVNGDLGRVVEVLRPTINRPEILDGEGRPLEYSEELIDAVENPSDWHPPVLIRVQLLRNGQMVDIPKITRYVWQYNEPHSWEIVDNRDRICEGTITGVRAKVWILGELTFFPIRLAYASTVHKTQGLTLDRVEIRLNEWLMGQPQMIYVALSRCKSPEGIRIIGTPGQLAGKVRIHDDVRRFL